MPTRAETSRREQEYEQEIRRAARRLSVDHSFRAAVLLENTPEAFATFLVTYFPHKIPTVEGWQMEPISVMVLEPRALILVPAGTMKTTIGSELHQIWRLCQNPDYEILGVFKDDIECKKVLGAIKKEFMFNEALIRDYGPFIPTGSLLKTHKCNDHEIDVVRRSRRSKQHSLMYFGFGSTVLGNRFHRGFCDDVVTREMARSPEMTKRFMEWASVDFETGPYAPDSDADWVGAHGRMLEQVMFQGTRMSPHDGYAKIEERNERGDPENPHFRPYKVVCVDLIKDEAKKLTISPRWPWAKAMAKKMELGPEGFAMRMRNIPLDPSVTVFKEAWLRGGDYNGVHYPGCRDKSLTFQSVEVGDVVVIGYDPQSGSTTRYAKNAALVALAVTPSDEGGWNPHLYNFWQGQTPMRDSKREDSQLTILLSWCKEINREAIVPYVVLEGNQVQRAFKEIIEDDAQNQGITLTVIVANTGSDKHDPESGVEATAVDFQNGWMRLPYATPADQAKILEFEQSMVEYGSSKYYDIPMAFWLARRQLFELRIKPHLRSQNMHRRLPAYMQRRYAAMGMGSTQRVVYAHQGPKNREDVE